MNRVRCPVCQREMGNAGPAEWPAFPFCSSRCKLIDLGRWLGEEYRIKAAPDGEGDSPAEPDDENIPP